MRLHDRIKTQLSPFLLLSAIQLFILGAALFVWLLHRGNLYSRAIALDEYIVSENTVVAEDVTTDDTMSEGGVFLTTPQLSLDKGTYTIRIDYNANMDENTISVSSSQLNSLELHCQDRALDPAYHTESLKLEIARNVTDLTVSASFSGKGYLSITGVSITENTDRYKRNLVRALGLCLLLDLCLLFLKSGRSSRRVILALGMIFGISCYPLYADYLPVGHDIPFHLLRIEGIAKGLSDHIFPVRIHPVWAKDYGYAVGVMYSNTFLYFPALLRRFGYSVQAAYKLYAAAVNLGTVVLSYFMFKRMFRSKKIGLLGCAVYSLSVYRLIDTYTRAAVGEYTAMMFFPVVLCGFYLILTESEKGNWRRYAVLTALGLTGLVQSHVLSCEMAAFIILPVCLFALSRHTIKPLVLAGLLSVLLNLGFLVPFLDYYNTDLYIVSGQWTGSNADRFQELGVFPLQLFSLFGHGTGTTLVTASGAAYECTVSVGIFPLLGLFLFCYLLLCHLKECRSRREFIPACVCTAFGCLFLYMSTCYFPWDAIASRNGWAKIVVDSLQFPWRLLAPSIALLTFTCCFSVKSFFACYGKTAAMPVLLSALTLLAVNCGWYFYDYMFSQDPYRVYDTNDLNSMTLYSCEYLPTGTDLENFESNLVAPSESISYTDYVKNGTSLSCHVTASGEAGFIDFPLTRYKYYTCVDTQTKIPLEISSGYNNRIRVTFPAGFDSDISIYFKEPVHWRIAEAVSLLTAAALCCCLSLASLRRRSKRPAQEA